MTELEHLTKLIESAMYWGADTPEKIAERLVDEGMIVPPCKVGDMVYRVSFMHNSVEMLKVEGFLRNLASWKVHCTHVIPSWVGNQKEHIYISFSSFGKAVFLAREEAEAALVEKIKASKQLKNVIN